MKVFKESYEQKKWIRWNQENYGKGCVKNQEVEVERDRPGQEVEQAIDAVSTKDVAGVH